MSIVTGVSNHPDHRAHDRVGPTKVAALRENCHWGIETDDGKDFPQRWQCSVSIITGKSSRSFDHYHDRVGPTKVAALREHCHWGNETDDGKDFPQRWQCSVSIITGKSSRRFDHYHDQSNSRIRQITASGDVSSIAGSPKRFLNNNWSFIVICLPALKHLVVHILCRTVCVSFTLEDIPTCNTTKIKRAGQAFVLPALLSVPLRYTATTLRNYQDYYCGMHLAYLLGGLSSPPSSHAKGELDLQLQGCGYRGQGYESDGCRQED